MKTTISQDNKLLGTNISVEGNEDQLTVTQKFIAVSAALIEAVLEKSEKKIVKTEVKKDDK